MNDTMLTAFSDALADATQRALGSVVTVRTGGGRAVSGVVVDTELVLTVEHVLGADTAVVETGSARHDASVAGRDPTTDLALLRVPGLVMTPVTAAPAEARLGSWVLAVARPAGSPMVSGGVVSGFGSVGRRRGGGTRWLLTDASPFPGFSGSALVNSAGELVGIVNAGVSRGEIVAVPAAQALEVARALRERGSMPRGYLGVATQPVRLPSGETGLLVVGVEDGSVAATGGMLIGDVLRHWNGEPVGGGDALLGRVSGSAGQTVKLGLLRGGQPTEVTLTVGTRERP